MSGYVKSLVTGGNNKTIWYSMLRALPNMEVSHLHASLPREQHLVYDVHLQVDSLLFARCSGVGTVAAVAALAATLFRS